MCCFLRYAPLWLQLFFLLSLSSFQLVHSLSSKPTNESSRGSYISLTERDRGREISNLETRLRSVEELLGALLSDEPWEDEVCDLEARVRREWFDSHRHLRVPRANYLARMAREERERREEQARERESRRRRYSDVRRACNMSTEEAMERNLIALSEQGRRECCKGEIPYSEGVTCNLDHKGVEWDWSLTHYVNFDVVSRHISYPKCNALVQWRM